MAAAYGLLNSGSLSPQIPGGFPMLAGFTAYDFLTAADHWLFFKEKTFMGLVGASTDEDLLVIVGTHTNLQWWLDFQAKPRPWTSVDGCSCQVESGFSDVYEAITLTGSGMLLRDWVAKQARNQRPLRILGHSLGAGVGGLAAGDAWRPRLRLFAMPKFSDILLSKQILGKMTDDSVVVRGVQDVVPMAPPLSLYQSVLPEAWFNSDTFGVSGEDAARHSMQECYLSACQLAAA